MFQLTQAEYENLRSQFVISKDKYENLRSQFATSSWGGRRKLPFAFTEHGGHARCLLLESSSVVITPNYTTNSVVMTTNDRIY